MVILMYVNELLTKISTKVEEILNVKIDSIKKLEHVTNNSVYKIITGKKEYIFKVYKQKSWPEDGKLTFVHNRLAENNIHCAKIIVFSRNDDYFINGFLIEECLAGISAEKQEFSLSEGASFYKKFAELVSKVHRIPIENYGYIGSGKACSETFTEFIEDSFNDHTGNLMSSNYFTVEKLLDIKKILIEMLAVGNDIPAVLCHGDLSQKNVIINESGELTLIDWDDAMSLSWVADIARLTFWMKLNYNKNESKHYRDIFLEHYYPIGDKNIYYVLENVLHVWYGLDFLNYFIGTPQYDQIVYYILY